MRPLTAVLSLGLLLSLGGLYWLSNRFAVAAPADRIGIVEVASGVVQPTDMAMWPGRDDVLVVLGKQGTAWWIDLDAPTEPHVWFSKDVPHASELGLLGLAFDPDFATTGRFWLHHSAQEGRQLQGRLVRMRVGDPSDPSSPVTEEATVFQVDQPYANHDGGQVRFGPDRMLYLALGDGGAGGDPKENGQDRSTPLGAIVRLDVRATPPEGATVAIPADNPFVGQEGAHPAVWAWGLRNPWRFDVLDDGRLVVGDVGQDAVEEIDLVSAGDNLGWNTWEGDRCFDPPNGCSSEGVVPPVHVYGHDQGQSVTGGVMYRGSAIPSLVGRYVFGDFTAGHVRSLVLPEAPGGALQEARHEAVVGGMVSAFANDAAGEVLFTDFGGGRILRLVPDG